MKKFKDLRLSTKFLVSIGLILVVLTAFDVWFGMNKEKKIMQKDIRKWTFVYAESVRTTLNTLMREGKMNMRWGMLDAMKQEISGVKNIRIIRSPIVNDIFKRVKEDDVVPRAKEIIEKDSAKISKLEKDLARTKDRDEASDLRDEIKTLQTAVKKAEADIENPGPISTDPREAPRDNLDSDVIKKGVPVYRFEGDSARVLVPYIAKKSCSSTTGCHKYAKEGDVLGAISMEFSTEDIQKDIRFNNIETAGVGAVRLAIILGILAFFLSYYVIRHIKTMLAGFRKLTTGDFTTRLPVTGEDEIGELAEGFNYFTNEINGVIKEMQNASRSLVSTSNGLSASSSSIADGAESQKGRAAQVATAAEELSATIQEIAQNSMSAVEAAKSTSMAAEKGGAVVTKSVDGMAGIVPIVKDSAAVVAELSSRSNEIGSIINVINDIADQTNLLALNAAIEAARAGEYGRGFAVVADEVRKLAERTTAGTKEVTGMVKAIQADAGRARATMETEVHAVEKAMGLAKETGAALEEIIKHVGNLTSMIQQIATATEEQSVTATQISSDIEAVSNVTTRTAGDVGQIASATDDLTRLSAKLRDIAASFRIHAEEEGGERRAFGPAVAKA
jgi:methyl-accepting chemotaxis protein